MDATVLNLDEPNKNGRVYTTEVAQAIIDQAAPRIAVGAMLGEVGYPTGDGFGSVDMGRISHQVENLRIEDGKLIGTFKILETPMGQIARELLDAAPNTAFRPRGLATIGPDGVVSDYQLISIDIVNDGA